MFLKINPKSLPNFLSNNKPTSAHLRKRAFICLVGASLEKEGNWDLWRIQTFPKLDIHHFLNHHNYLDRGGYGEMEVKRDWRANGTQLLRARSSAICTQAIWLQDLGSLHSFHGNNGRAWTLNTHLTRTYHKGYHEPVILLEGSGDGKEGGRSRI